MQSDIFPSSDTIDTANVLTPKIIKIPSIVATTRKLNVKAPKIPPSKLLRDRIQDKLSVLRAQCSEKPNVVRLQIETLTKLRSSISGGVSAFKRRKEIERTIEFYQNELQDLQEERQYKKYVREVEPYLERLTAWEEYERNRMMEVKKLEEINKTSNTAPQVTNDATTKGTALKELLFTYKGEQWTEQDLYEDYMASVERSFAAIDVLSSDDCPDCKAGLFLSPDGSLLLCHNCGYGAPYIDATSATIAYGDEVEFVVAAHRQNNHVIEWLTKFTYEESGIVPEQILQNIRYGLQEDGIKPDDINHQTIYAVLKRLGYRKYYDYLSQICTRITGRDPPKMSPEEKWKFKTLFRAIQEPFERHRPADRTNFLTCQFVADCLLQLIGRQDLLPYLRALGDDKKKKQRITMDKILAELGLEMPEPPPDKSTNNNAHQKSAKTKRKRVTRRKQSQLPEISSNPEVITKDTGILQTEPQSLSADLSMVPKAIPDFDSNCQYQPISCAPGSGNLKKVDQFNGDSQSPDAAATGVKKRGRKRKVVETSSHQQQTLLPTKISKNADWMLDEI